MKLLILLVSVGIVFGAEEVKIEKDVLVLTQKNFDEVVNDQAMVLVEFCKYRNLEAVFDTLLLVLPRLKFSLISRYIV